MTDEKLLTVAEVAARLRVGRRTLQVWCETGRMRAYRLGPAGLWRVPESALPEMLVENERPRTRTRSASAEARYREACESLRRDGLMA